MASNDDLMASIRLMDSAIGTGQRIVESAVRSLEEGKPERAADNLRHLVVGLRKVREIARQCQSR